VLDVQAMRPWREVLTLLILAVVLAAAVAFGFYLSDWLLTR